MKIRRRSRRKPIIPINAMADIAFLLLIFIMLISLINYRREIKIEYAEAKLVETTQESDNFEIWVANDGRMFLEGRQADLRAVEGEIASQIMNNPKVRIHILADKDTPYRHINGIMEILKLLQHRVVSLVIRETEGS
ncbi:MAG: biopolymer transporter ExbD [Spirochaetales bacterium]|nr:biopolymer transporter ExbD [Spirochaetales bacterium]